MKTLLLSPGQYAQLKKEDVCFIEDLKGTFIGIYDPDKTNSIAYYFAANLEYEKIIASHDFEHLLTQIKNSPNIEIKIISSLKSIHRLVSFFENKSFNVKQKYYDSAEKMEVYFFSKDGKLKFSKTADACPMPKNSPIRVLIVDDSQSVRKIIRHCLELHPEKFNVVAEVDDPLKVEKAIKDHAPDVITLDIHMPHMNGIDLLEKIHPLYKIPTLLISSLNASESSLVIRGLEIGATDYIQKPSLESMDLLRNQLYEKIPIAYRQKNRKLKKTVLKSNLNKKISNKVKLIAMGASTGGTDAVKEVLIQLPSEIPPIVIVQHIPETFSKAFADRLNHLCGFKVKEAQDGDVLERNTVYIAPGGKQMSIKKQRINFQICISDDAPMNRHKPSVDYLFKSVAQHFKNDAIGVLLTGMGADGAQGLLEMKNAGSHTIVQSEETCVVFGMPKAAIDINAHTKIADLVEVHLEICQY